MKYNKINKSKVSGMPSRSTTDNPSSTVLTCDGDDNNNNTNTNSLVKGGWTIRINQILKTY